MLHHLNLQTTKISISRNKRVKNFARKGITSISRRSKNICFEDRKVSNGSWRMVKCYSNYDCPYSTSINYCKELDGNSTRETDEGECMWTWGFWVAIVLLGATGVFILVVCIFCISRNCKCSRKQSNLEWS